MKKIIFAVILLISVLFTVSAQESLINSEDSPAQFFFETEQGFLSVLNHTYQVGSGGDEFDFRTQGGQEILFPFERYSVGLELFDKHRITYTYQPLTILTNVVFQDDVTIDTVTFADGTPVAITYGFPFYRVSYTYDLLGNDPNRVVGVGAALQFRNASISFASADGEQLSVSQNLGPVPALSFYSRWKTPFGMILSTDITGVYASSALFNGADFDFAGSLLDASLRAGYVLKNGSEVFGNLRYFGGSAEGTSQYPDLYWTESVEDYTANYISTLTASLGITLR
jgi:hypothetical protein